MRRAGPLLLALIAIIRTAPASASVAATAPSPPSLEACDARVRDHPDDADGWWCFQEAAAATGRFEDAQRIVSSRLALDSSNYRPKILLGVLEQSRGESNLRAGATAAAAAGDDLWEAKAHLNLGYILDQSGRADEAGLELERATRFADALGNATLQAEALTYTGLHDTMRGDYGKAWTEYKRAEAIVFPDGEARLRAGILNGLGNICGSTGREAEALDYYRRQAEILHAIPNFHEEAFPLYNIAFLADKTAGDDWAPVRLLFQEALDVAVRGGNLIVESSARMKLARDPDPALTAAARLDHVERALAIARQSGSIQAVGPALRQVAVYRFVADPEHPSSAFGALEEATDRARRDGDREELARDLILRGEMRRIAGPRDQACAESLEALDAIERVRDLQQDDLVRARVHSRYVHAYLRFSGFLLETLGASGTPDDLDLAFRVAEQMRGRALLDALDAAQATEASTRLPAPLAEKRSTLLRTLASVQKRLMDPDLPRQERPRALAELERLEAEELGLRDDLARSSPEFAAVRRPSIPSLRDLEGLLEADEALLSFQLWNRRLRAGDFPSNFGSWLVLVTREGARAFPLPDREPIGESVSWFHALLERRDGREAEAAARIFRELLAPALATLGPAVGRLIVIPDGPLNALPFDALRAAPGDPPLGARYEISIAPSAALWVRLRAAAGAGPQKPALALADPEIRNVDPQAAPTRDATLAVGMRLPPLPYSRSEARSVVRAFGPRSRMLAGPDASERFMKTASLGEYGVLHLAAHAVVDDLHPDRTAIVLAPGATDEDGLLQIREIVGLDLRNQVVILSACRSASGAVLPGEGVIGLSRGFFQAGARAVVGSLWTLHDEEAADLISDLARELGSGKSVGAALAAARRARIDAGAPARVWAGFVVLGDAGAIPIPGGRAAPAPDFTRRTLAVAALVLGALFATAAIASLALRRRHPEGSSPGRSS